jgi:hypothetical protein
VACPHPDPPPLDPMGLSVVLGSSESGTTGHLASAECSDNPYTLTLQLGEQGDAVLLNNIPFDCTAAPAPAPALDARGIVLALLVLFGVAALDFRRRRVVQEAAGSSVIIRRRDDSSSGISFCAQSIVDSRRSIVDPAWPRWPLPRIDLSINELSTTDY